MGGKEGGSPGEWGTGGVREVAEERVGGGSSTRVRSGRSRGGEITQKCLIFRN